MFVRAYLRTSSAANVGADKDSEKRQRAAIETFAKAAGYKVEGCWRCWTVIRGSLRRPYKDGGADNQKGFCCPLS